MAEALLIHRLAGKNIKVTSAGVAPLAGHPADPLAQLVMLQHGLDISAHRAQHATQALMTGMDVILTLEQFHSNWIHSRFPHLQGRVHKLGRWQNNLDIADPYRMPQEAFETAFIEIEKCVADWAERLVK